MLSGYKVSYSQHCKQKKKEEKSKVYLSGNMGCNNSESREPYISFRKVRHIMKKLLIILSGNAEQINPGYYCRTYPVDESFKAEGYTENALIHSGCPAVYSGLQIGKY